MIVLRKRSSLREGKNPLARGDGEDPEKLTNSKMEEVDGRPGSAKSRAGSTCWVQARRWIKVGTDGHAKAKFAKENNVLGAI